jgi:hypothetical protein
MVFLHLTQHNCRAGAGACHVPAQELVCDEKLFMTKRNSDDNSSAVSSAMDGRPLLPPCKAPDASQCYKLSGRRL